MFLHKQRIVSIDILRGMVTLIMAIDHVREYFPVTAFTSPGSVIPLDTTHCKGYT